MKKAALFLVLAFQFSFSQSEYKPAFYLSNSGVKTEGFINDYNFYAGDFIYFKKSLTDEEIQINIKNISELQIENKLKYVSRMVDYNVDNTTNQTKTKPDPVLEKKQLLLKVLVEGDASLYLSYLNDIPSFYLKMANSDEIQYLINHTYTFESIVNENAKFRRQLLEKLNCGNNYSYEKFVKLKYYSEQLIKTVNEYNVCKNGVTSDLTKNEVKDKFKLSVLLGMKFYKAEISNRAFYVDKFSESSISPSVGIELSYLLPVMQNSAEMFLRVNFDRAKFSYATQNQVNQGVTYRYDNFDFSSYFAHFNFGPRYYINNRANNSVFVDFSFEITVPFGNESNFSYGLNPNSTNLKEAETKIAASLNFGLGYRFLKRYAVEARYTLNTNYFSDSVYGQYGLSSKFSSVGVNLRYNFL